MIRSLIEESMTADQKNNEWTALHWAANEGDVIFFELEIQTSTSKHGEIHHKLNIEY